MLGLKLIHVSKRGYCSVLAAMLLIYLSHYPRIFWLEHTEELRFHHHVTNLVFPHSFSWRWGVIMAITVETTLGTTLSTNPSVVHFICALSSCYTALDAVNDNIMTWKSVPWLLALCEGNPLVTSRFPSQRATNAECWCFLYCLVKLLTKW